MSRKWLAVPAVTLFILVSYVAITQIVFQKAVQKMTEKGFTVNIGHISVGMMQATLSNLYLTSSEFPKTEIRLDSVSVALKTNLEVSSITVDGGNILSTSTIEEIQSQFKAWKEKHSGETGKSKSSTPLILSNISVELNKSVIRGLSLRRIGDGKTEIRVENAHVTTHGHKLELNSAEVELDKHKIQVQKLDIVETESQGTDSKEMIESISKTQQIENLVKKFDQWVMLVQNSTIKTHRISITSDDVMIESQNGSVEVLLRGAEIQARQKSIVVGSGQIEVKAADDVIDLEILAKSIGTKHEVLGGQEITSKPIRIMTRIQEKSDMIEFNDITIEVNGKPVAYSNISLGTEKTLSISIPQTECQDLLDAIPSGLANKTSGTSMSGKLKVQLHVETIPRADPKVSLTVNNSCKVSSIPDELQVQRLKKVFKRTAYGSNGQEIEVETGPGSKNWVPLNHISPFMEDAIRTTEDPGFRGHRGFDVGAIENSIRDDIATGKFLRGASTVTMQLAKNLWLKREKTLSRKLQEAILTVYLEQSLTKNEILELYLNVVEFGPNIYGIGPASMHFFHTSPDSLSLGQALYLASVMPRPKVQYFDKDGKISENHMKYLHALMKLMRDRKTISEEEMQEGITEWVIFESSQVEHRGSDKEPAATNVRGLDPADWN